MSAGRKYLSEREWDALFERQGFACAVFGCGNDGPWEADHSTANAFVAGKPDQILCREHHVIKTKRDVKAIAKAKRLSGETSSQYSRRQKRGPLLKSARKLIGRGFDKTLRKLFDGSVVKR